MIQDWSESSKERWGLWIVEKYFFNVFLKHIQAWLEGVVWVESETTSKLVDFDPFPYQMELCTESLYAFLYAEENYVSSMTYPFFAQQPLPTLLFMQW